jgi:diguanylate cyclase (GGDEF)-like protein
MNFLEIPEKQGNPYYVVAAAFALTGIIGVVDFLTGYEIAFSLFYVLPVALVTWLANRRLGLATSVAGAVVWYWADVGSGHSYPHPLIPVWNTVIRLGFFVIITLLLSELRRATERERELARTDSLTGAVNSRFFYDLAQMEIDRFQRYEHPFTLAYIDLDNFKAVNDRFGHPAGDEVLRTVVSSARTYLRKTDVFARIGGDEFVLLMPETNEESACAALSKILDGLKEEMRLGDWPVTFSVGVLTCNAAPPSTGDLVRMADELMYSVKRAMKNGMKCSTYPG